MCVRGTILRVLILNLIVTGIVLLDRGKIRNRCTAKTAKTSKKNLFAVLVVQIPHEGRIMCRGFTFLAKAFNWSHPMAQCFIDLLRNHVCTSQPFSEEFRRRHRSGKHTRSVKDLSEGELKVLWTIGGLTSRLRPARCARRKLCIRVFLRQDPMLRWSGCLHSVRRGSGNCQKPGQSIHGQ
jgi:hypothetical protein